MLQPLVRRLVPSAFVFLAACVGSRNVAQSSLTERYRETAGRILGAALVDDEGWKKLEYLTTRIGHRLSGSTGLERAIEWAAAAMKAEGLEARTQAAMVPHWVRGHESVEVLRPVARTLGMLGLGMSVEMLQRVYGHHHPDYLKEATHGISYGSRRSRTRSLK